MIHRRFDRYHSGVIPSSPVGVVWSDHQVRLIRCASKDTDPRVVFLSNFSQCVKLCPEGAKIMFESYSDDLVSGYDRMMVWKERTYEGLDPSEVDDVWKRISGFLKPVIALSV
jgi:hypothetical protein